MRTKSRETLNTKSARFRLDAWAVGEPRIRDLYGAMHHVHADRAFLVTTGRVTTPAWRWARDKPIEIWDHRKIRELLASPVEYEAPPQPRASIRKAPPIAPSATYRAETPPAPHAPAPPPCPKCGAPLVERVDRSTAQRFFGCSGFPRCRFSQPLETSSSPTPSPQAPAPPQRLNEPATTTGQVVRLNRFTFGRGAEDTDCHASPRGSHRPPSDHGPRPLAPSASPTSRSR